MNKSYVLDACALIALLRNESGAEEVAKVLSAALDKKVTVHMNIINLLEIYYDLYRITSRAKADEELSVIKKLPITLQSNITNEIFTEAGRLKASYKISLADSIALAQALTVNGELLTADHHEFDGIAQREPVKFYWIR
ncbi:MAG: PIN domain-containing protein [Clostridiales bacterium]|jgi:PIN domain nuclease of toxin-antitoxin system|nr:PIN domain-containing protein [Clostridiales bacterium]